MLRKTALLLTCLTLPAWAQDDISGAYDAVATVNGTEMYGKMELQQKGSTLTGKYMGDDITGTRKGNAIDFVAREKSGEGANVHMTVKNGVLTGTATAFDGTDHHTTYMT